MFWHYLSPVTIVILLQMYCECYNQTSYFCVQYNVVLKKDDESDRGQLYIN